MTSPRQARPDRRGKAGTAEREGEGEKRRTERRKAVPAVQESFDFLKEIGPYKPPPVTLLDPVEKKEVTDRQRERPVQREAYSRRS